MRSLEINATPNSPRVSFDPDKSQFEISGESRPENASSFYKPILEWGKEIETIFKSNSKAFVEPLKFDFSLDYFNSTSAKYILDFCKIIGNLSDLGVPLKVRWLYEKDDEDMLTVGQEMARMAKINFEYVETQIDNN